MLTNNNKVEEATEDPKALGIPIDRGNIGLGDGKQEVNQTASDAFPTTENVQAPAAQDLAFAEKRIMAPFSTVRHVTVITALCLCTFFAALDVTIITTALPTISEHFGSVAGYAWVGAAYTLAEAASTPSWGKISDIWGRKPILQIAIAVFFLGSVLSATSASLPILIVGRSIQGIGGGGLLTLVNIVIGDLFSVRKRGKYYSFVGITWAVAASIGPVVDGILTEKVSWRCALTGAAFVVILLLFELNTTKTPILSGLQAVDWLGSFSIVGSTVMVLLGLEFGGASHPWNSAIVICLIVFGFLTAMVFILIEWKVARYPLLPLRLFSDFSNAATLMACFIHGTVFVTGTFYLPLYFQGVLGTTPLLSGVWLLPFAGAMALAASVTGWFISATGSFLEPVWFGFAFLTLGFGLLVDLGPTRNWPKIVIFQILAGLGVGPNFQAPLIALQNGVSPQDLATATAAFGFDRNLASSIGVVIGGVIFQNGVHNNARELLQSLGPAGGFLLNGGAIESTGKVDSLPDAQRALVRSVFRDALEHVWIFAVAFSAVGLVIIMGIQGKTLNSEHFEVKLGIDGEEE